MKYFKLTLAGLITILFFSLMNSGCSKSSDSPTEAVIETEATNDAAEAVGMAVSSDAGGITDDLESVSFMDAEAGPISESDIPGIRNAVRVYDSVNGWWTITVTKERVNPVTGRTASYSRVNKVQFLNVNGQFQKYYRTPTANGTDTAYTIKHQIVSASGSTISAKGSSNLVSLSAGWTTIHANNPLVTINSDPAKPYTKVSADTIYRNGAVRTLNSTLTLNFNNLVGPRKHELNWDRKLSGTITGTYHAEVTFQKGDTYKEKTIDRTILINIDGLNSKLDIGGKRFKLNPETGEVL